MDSKSVLKILLLKLKSYITKSTRQTMFSESPMTRKWLILKGKNLKQKVYTYNFYVWMWRTNKHFAKDSNNSRNKLLKLPVSIQQSFTKQQFNLSFIHMYLTILRTLRDSWIEYRNLWQYWFVHYFMKLIDPSGPKSIRCFEQNDFFY